MDCEPRRYRPAAVDPRPPRRTRRWSGAPRGRRSPSPPRTDRELPDLHHGQRGAERPAADHGWRLNDTRRLGILPKQYSEIAYTARPEAGGFDIAVIDLGRQVRRSRRPRQLRIPLAPNGGTRVLGKRGKNWHSDLRPGRHHSAVVVHRGRQQRAAGLGTLNRRGRTMKLNDNLRMSRSAGAM